MPDPVKVFVSYSHQDAEYLADDSLLGYLKGLEKEDVMLWTDRHITAGELWDNEIKANLQDSQLALVLVSQALFNFRLLSECRDQATTGPTDTPHTYHFIGL